LVGRDGRACPNMFARWPFKNQKADGCAVSAHLLMTWQVFRLVSRDRRSPRSPSKC